MPNDVATLATWQINSTTQGNKRLRRMDDWDVSDGGSVEAVPEVGNPQMVAFTRKPGAQTISFTFKEMKGAVPDVDWRFLRDSGEVFSLTRQITGGMRTQYPECMVSSVSPSGDAEGKVTYKVEVIGLAEEPM